MTYCVGIKAHDGIVFASDSRTNAGLDNVNIYSKMYTYDVGDRTVIIVTSGNLGTSQAVFKSIDTDLREKRNIEIIAISKRQPLEKLITALDCGHKIFGENQVQEALKKWPLLKKNYQNLNFVRN